jgi:UDPglucose 6-dehydrogenase
LLDESGFETSVGSNPEFITEIHNTWSEDSNMKRDWSNEDKIVIGSEDDTIREILNKIYGDFENKIINTDTKTAEMIKYASNVCLASKISFFNEMFEICNEVGVDNIALTKALSMDSRIGKYGTINGKAYGGKCLPKDSKALQYFLREKLESPMIDATIEVNDKMKDKYGVRE